jgi:predicted phage tail protein
VEREEWHLDVKSVSEAIRAININTRGALETYLAGPAKARLYRIALQKRDNVIDPKEATNRSGRSTIYIMPTIRGRNSGLGKVLAGIALIALTYGAAAGFLGAAAGNFVGAGAFGAIAGGSATLAGTVLMGFGISLLLGGISQILTPRPQGPNASPDQNASTTFPGTAAVVTQGGTLPVVYGRALVAPIPIAITTSNNDVSSTAAGTTGGVTATPLPGGGTQYNPILTDGQE